MFFNPVITTQTNHIFFSPHGNIMIMIFDWKWKWNEFLQIGLQLQYQLSNDVGIEISIMELGKYKLFLKFLLG